MQTTHFDPEMSALADRHYSRRTPGARQFCYSGRKLVLRNAEGTILWVWMFPLASLRIDGQTGYNCAIFRNESRRKSSTVILEAEQFAIAKWGPGRAYTFVDSTKIRSVNPGCCYKAAGWTFSGMTKSGKHIFEKQLQAETMRHTPYAADDDEAKDYELDRLEREKDILEGEETKDIEHMKRMLEHAKKVLARRHEDQS